MKTGDLLPLARSVFVGAPTWDVQVELRESLNVVDGESVLVAEAFASPNKSSSPPDADKTHSIKAVIPFGRKAVMTQAYGGAAPHQVNGFFEMQVLQKLQELLLAELAKVST